MSVSRTLNFSLNLYFNSRVICELILNPNNICEINHEVSCDNGISALPSELVLSLAVPLRSVHLSSYFMTMMEKEFIL